jgi:hypothetical protein
MLSHANNRRTELTVATSAAGAEKKDVVVRPITQGAEKNLLYRAVGRVEPRLRGQGERRPARLRPHERHVRGRAAPALPRPRRRQPREGRRRRGRPQQQRRVDLAACHVGRQYCNNGLCNPAYFTIGNLLRYLQGLEASGLSREEIVDRYVFFTAGSCGPCRFGMYEAEYRLALRNAGFDDFRVLLFQQGDGVKADTGEPGLKLSLHLGLGAANAFAFADALQAFGYETRPYETTPGPHRPPPRAGRRHRAGLHRGAPARPMSDRPGAGWLRPYVERGRLAHFAAPGNSSTAPCSATCSRPAACRSTTSRSIGCA